MKYRYKGSFYVFGYLIAPIAIIFIVSYGISFLIVPDAIEKNYWFGALLCFIIGAALITFTVGGLLKHRPISIDETGASTYFFGRPMRHISWSEMRRIERRRYIDPQRSITRYKYSIYGQEGRIWFDDKLQNVRNALDALNEFAHKNGIDLIEIDVGIDTRKRLRDTITDPIGRKKLLHEGIKTRIQSL